MAFLQRIFGADVTTRQLYSRTTRSAGRFTWQIPLSKRAVTVNFEIGPFFFQLIVADEGTTKPLNVAVTCVKALSDDLFPVYGYLHICLASRQHPTGSIHNNTKEVQCFKKGEAFETSVPAEILYSDRNLIFHTIALGSASKPESSFLVFGVFMELVQWGNRLCPIPMVVGLPNPSPNRLCHVLSVIQPLFHIPLFRSLVIQLGKKSSSNRITKALGSIFDAMSNGSSEIPIKALTEWFTSEGPFRDAGLVLIQLLDAIESNRSGLTNEAQELMSSMFGGVAHDYSQHIDGSQRVQERIFRCLDIPLQNHMTLEDTFMDLLARQDPPESNVITQTVVDRLPWVLILRVGRFPRDERQVPQKCNDYIEFGQEVDMGGYIGSMLRLCPACGTHHFYKATQSEEVWKSMESEYHESELDEDDECPPLPDSDLYTLHATVVHQGAARQGHFYSFVKVEGKWVRCDDQYVCPVADVSEVFENTYGLRRERSLSLSSLSSFLSSSFSLDSSGGNNSPPGGAHAFANGHIGTGTTSSVHSLGATDPGSEMDYSDDSYINDEPPAPRSNLLSVDQMVNYYHGCLPNPGTSYLLFYIRKSHYSKLTDNCSTTIVPMSPNPSYENLQGDNDDLDGG